MECSSTSSKNRTGDVLKISKDVIKLQWQCKVRGMSQVRLPAIANRAVWDKTTISWGDAVERVRKEKLGNQEDALYMEKSWGVQDINKKRMEITEINASVEK